MGNLNLILFVSFALPLFISFFVCKGRVRAAMLFFFIGMAVCLFCGELSAIALELLPYDKQFFSCNIAPFFEELFKAFPILVFVFVYKPGRRMLYECSVMVGIGFAILENAFILGGMSETVSLLDALMRGLGAGLMHGLCTLAVGYGMSFVHTRRKLFRTGTVAMLAVATVYHATYNTIVQSSHLWMGVLLPVITLVPVLILMDKTENNRNKNNNKNTN
ncbi:MAG: PrsW family intramembrane metalloprotease [Oscillospiraceae bacterium]|nr:PrsW family intramembrane metalloprotease [Candidatus Ruminococcus equi]